jgi:hypothetical protein
MMDEKITYWAAVAFGALALVLLVLNISFINGNRALQDEINQRQAVLNRGQTLNQVNQGLVQALANVAVKDNDAQVRDLLAAQGITLKSKADAAASATDTAATPKVTAHKKKAAPAEPEQAPPATEDTP